MRSALTDVEAEVLRDAQHGRLIFGRFGTDGQLAVTSLRQRWLLDGGPYPGITRAGREARAESEGNHVGS